MKVLCVIDSLGSGGGQRQMMYLLRGLREKGVDVSLFVCKAGYDHYKTEVLSLDIPLYESGDRNRNGFSIAVLVDLISLIRKDNYTVLSFLPSANFYAALSQLALLRSSLIVSQRTSSVAKASKFKTLINILTYYVANAVTTNSYSESERLCSTLPKLRKKIHTVWNGYDNLSFRKYVAPNVRIQRLLVVGRQAHMKNGVNLLKALVLFKDRFGWVPQVDWAGRKEIDSRSVAMQEEMSELLEQHAEIANNWTWLGEVSEVEPLFRQADALVHISLYEGLPNAICEAMFLGCPVIASNVCDHPALLGSNQERGLLCDPLSPESIYDAVAMLNRKTPQMRDKMVQAAHDFAISNLSVERMVSNYVNLLTDFSE
jgi:glycosyltransferase involved in cell wall biosynthesis